MMFINSVRIVSLCILLLCSGCMNQSAEKLPAKSLSMDNAARQSLYGAQRGPYAVKEINPYQLQPDAEARHKVPDAIPIKIAYPDAQGPFPLLIFTHGFGADMNQYDNVVHHWVSHGYVVIATTHIDSANLFVSIINTVRYGQLGIMMRRPLEISYVLERLDFLEDTFPALKAKIDTDNIALTGHSFGAFTAQMFAGALAFDDEGNAQPSYKDRRIKAVVSLSPPGEMFDAITTKSWLEMDKPVLITTGTWDSNSFFWPDWRAHLLSHDTAKPGNNFALVIEGMDHYLGNLICRLDREEAPQHDALLMVNAVSTAFLDAHLKSNTQALNILHSDVLSQLTGGFSQISRR